MKVICRQCFQNLIQTCTVFKDLLLVIVIVVHSHISTVLSLIIFPKLVDPIHWVDVSTYFPFALLFPFGYCATYDNDCNANQDDSRRGSQSDDCWAWISACSIVEDSVIVCAGFGVCIGGSCLVLV